MDNHNCVHMHVDVNGPLGQSPADTKPSQCDGHSQFNPPPTDVRNGRSHARTKTPDAILEKKKKHRTPNGILEKQHRTPDDILEKQHKHRTPYSRNSTGHWTPYSRNNTGQRTPDSINNTGHRTQYPRLKKHETPGSVLENKTSDTGRHTRGRHTYARNKNTGRHTRETKHRST